MEQNSKMESNNQKLLKGTMILTISSVVVKVIGSLNWIILSRVMGGEGIGLYQMGFPIYLMAITISSAGIPVAISIITAERLAQKDYLGAQRVFHISLRLLLVTGIVFSASLFFGANWLIENHWIRDARAYYSIIALAPAVFFVTFLSSFRGYLQGWQIMTPTAASEIVEQLTRVVTMLFFAHLLMPYGLAYAAGGASMGAGVGAFCGLITLYWFYKRLKKKFQKEIAGQTRTFNREKAWSVIKRLVKLAIPVSLSSLMLPVVANLDLLIVPQRLEVAGFNVSEATEMFGYLTGMAVPLINLATILTASMAMSLVPAISESRVLNDVVGIKAKLKTAFSVTSIITIPCTIGLFILAEKIATMIYNAPHAAPAIQTMSTAIFMLGLHQVSTGILQGLGKTTIPVINMIIAAVCKVVLSWTLTAVPELGIKGAAWATVADIGVAALINVFFIYKYTGFCLPLGGVLKPFVAATVMGGAVYGVLTLTPSWGAWNILASMLVAVPIYTVALILVGGLHQKEAAELPVIGRRIIALGQKIGYYK
ncbi:MAG TPA: polysaccharide biosynthesis protein [Candidatus Avacidaminococcus intestinavium]|uniref:Polysaccharide biosynthesis protein n=1 Tax=Candidatus Avacidaminococcus intestinavium TaxID=2840684 RepID=A0A9D1MPP4_9FIRM|nr:polysaccharide biosynthesis protein [Candidatus Avacidaminococcus intestinavium]